MNKIFHYLGEKMGLLAGKNGHESHVTVLEFLENSFEKLYSLEEDGITPEGIDEFLEKCVILNVLFYYPDFYADQPDLVKYYEIAAEWAQTPMDEETLFPDLDIFWKKLSPKILEWALFFGSIYENNWPLFKEMIPGLDEVDEEIEQDPLFDAIIGHYQGLWAEHIYWCLYVGKSATEVEFDALDDVLPIKLEAKSYRQFADTCKNLSDAALGLKVSEEINELWEMIEAKFAPQKDIFLEVLESEDF